MRAFKAFPWVLASLYCGCLPGTVGPDDPGGSNGGTGSSSSGGAGSSSGGLATWSWDDPTPTGVDLYGVWAAAADNIYVAGGAGTVLRWNGREWEPQPLDSSDTLHAVWGSGPDDVWVVGGDYGPVAWWWNGVRWSRVEVPGGDGLRSVHGTGFADVWAVGGTGLALHLDETRWTAVPSGTSADLGSVWAAAPDDVWVAGGDKPLHWNGQQFAAVDAGPDSSVAVWGLGPADVWVSSTAASDIWHFDGAVWTPYTISGWYAASGFWGRATDDVWAIAGQGALVHFNGQQWSSETHSDWPGTLRGIHGTGSVVLVVGTEGTLARQPGSAWERVGTRVLDFSISDAWVEESTGILWAVGSGVAQHDGTRWTETVDPVLNWQTFRAVWAARNGDVWLGGWDVFRRMGGVWQEESTFATVCGWSAVEDIWGSAPDDVYFVSSSRICHWNGQAFEVSLPSPPSTLMALSGSGPADIWAVGSQGTALHYDGASWTTFPSPTTSWESITAVNALSPGNVLVSTSYWGSGKVVSWEGGAWRTVATAEDSLYSLLALSLTEMWAGGASGRGIYVNHGAVTGFHAHAPMDLVALARSPDGTLRGFGNAGIVRYGRPIGPIVPPPPASSSSGGAVTTSSGPVAVSSSSRASSSSSRPPSSAPSASSSSSSRASSTSAAAPSSSVALSSSAPAVCAGQPAGTPCGAAAICDGTGQCVVGCLADGLVRTALQSHPTDNCLHCNPAVSTSGWSADTGQTCTDGDLCTGPDTCTAAAVCTGPAVCTGQTPTCVSGSGVCQCSPGPPDSCAVGTNSFHCLGDGTCGCLDSNGCAAGFICGPSNGCVACDADPAVCGNTCADCRSLPQSVGEGNSYQCTSNVLPLAQACQLAPCAAGRADCNGLDVDACETNLTNQPASCGSCTTVCASGACANGMCDCGASTCPHGQQCRNGRCRCRNDGECDQAAGYQCNTNNDRCER